MDDRRNSNQDPNKQRKKQTLIFLGIAAVILKKKQML